MALAGGGSWFYGQAPLPEQTALYSNWRQLTESIVYKQADHNGDTFACVNTQEQSTGGYGTAQCTNDSAVTAGRYNLAGYTRRSIATSRVFELGASRPYQNNVHFYTS